MDHGAGGKKERLQQRLLFFSVINLLIVALLGLLLRAFPFLHSFPFSFKNVLHGHSHFAFAGWVTPVLLYLVLKQFPALKAAIPYYHWRNVTLLFLLSAYGMLVSFPLQGYKAVSISFSTIAIFATVYLALCCRKASKRLPPATSLRFLNAGLFYACLSAAGPLALGPLMVLQKSGSPLYFDAIYFYLHFQYNGFFTFLVLALVFQVMENNGTVRYGKGVFLLFNSAAFPTYALSVLWHQPGIGFNWIGGGAALLQVAGVIYLLKDGFAFAKFRSSFLWKTAAAAFLIKLMLQVISAVPRVAELAYVQRNFIIAYLHLVLLGFVTTAIFGFILKMNKWSRTGLFFFFFSFFTTEILLLLNASSGTIRIAVPYYLPALFIFSFFFPVGVFLLLVGLHTQRPTGPVRVAAKGLRSASVNG